MEFIETTILVLLLLFIHELGHITMAKILGLPIQRIGFQLRPYPHFYVSVKWPRVNWEKYLYLFSGTFITVSLFCISIYNEFFHLTQLYWAFVIQLIIETNPFYSDFTIAIVSRNKPNNKVKSYAENYKLQFEKYKFTLKWYVHFIIWAIIILSLTKFKNTLL